jgi:cytochrome c
MRRTSSLSIRRRDFLTGSGATALGVALPLSARRYVLDMRHLLAPQAGGMMGVIRVALMSPKFKLALLVAATLAIAKPAAAQDDVEAGRKVFSPCRACHLLVANRHMTGPSLVGVFGRKSGTAEGYPRYSPAMRQANVAWSAETLDKFLADPQGFIKGNWMTFPGVEDAKDRANLIAFLKKASELAAAAPPGKAPSLKSLPQRMLVTGIRLCGDTYYVTHGDGATKVFWEFNLRFKSNSTEEGPEPGKPAILRAGMGGDRASVIFASPKEISEFIKVKCE